MISSSVHKKLKYKNNCHQIENVSSMERKNSFQFPQKRTTVVTHVLSDKVNEGELVVTEGYHEESVRLPDGLSLSLVTGSPFFVFFVPNSGLSLDFGRSGW